MSTIEPASAARRASIAGASAAGCTACDATLAAEARRARNWPTGVAAALAWSALGALTRLWPN
ncbi:ABC transporter permease, partial [Burkholderia vietnamiensis]|nr:ABC transporter permease [Burkholderia vietnamiensis]